jgi:hypothetical protein
MTLVVNQETQKVVAFFAFQSGGSESSVYAETKLLQLQPCETIPQSYKIICLWNVKQEFDIVNLFLSLFSPLVWFLIR